MANPITYKSYYFDVDTFTKIVHAVEEIPTRAPLRSDSVADSITTDNIKLWERLFNLTHREAQAAIYDWRSEAEEEKAEVTEEILQRWPWEACQYRGFNEEAYAFWIDCVAEFDANLPRDMGAFATNSEGRFELFFKPEDEDQLAILNHIPDLRRPNGIALYSVFNNNGLRSQVAVVRLWESLRLRDYLAVVDWKSIPLDRAAKDLCSTLRFPYVHDSTLPQHRLNEGEIPRPLQDEYPVWYFLTGQISRPEKLQTLLKLTDLPQKRLATVHGLTYVRDGLFNYLVESILSKQRQHKNCSEGVAYLLMNKISEDRLRCFQTSLFKAIRCKLTLHPTDDSSQPHDVDGLAFVLNPEGVLWSVQEAEDPESPDAATLERSVVKILRREIVGLTGTGEGDQEAGVEAGAEEQIPQQPNFLFSRLNGEHSRDPRQTVQRRRKLMSPSRPKSRLFTVTNSSDLKTPPITSILDAPEREDISRPSRLSDPVIGNRTSTSKSKSPDRGVWWIPPQDFSIAPSSEASSSRAELTGAIESTIGSWTGNTSHEPDEGISGSSAASGSDSSPIEHLREEVAVKLVEDHSTSNACQGQRVEDSGSVSALEDAATGSRSSDISQEHGQGDS